ncbi:MAG: hypothetical protein AAF821_03525 [Cyanobacteria bacterium P01_D01_bin.156]
MADKATQIATSLRKALLENGPMVQALYKYELEENIDYWHKSILKDKEDFAIVITENRRHVAMLLIDTDKTLYINEAAREKLQSLWPQTYMQNMLKFIPMIVDDVLDNHFFFTGVKIHK